MAYSPSQCRASRKYNERMYERLQIYVSCGRKAIYQAAAEQRGMSLNAYVRSLLEADVQALGLSGLEGAEAPVDEPSESG